MATFMINHNLNEEARKIARRYKVNPDLVNTITMSVDEIEINYIEEFKNGETGICSKKIYRSNS